MASVLAQISDPHLRSGPDGPAAAAALERAVRAIAELPTRADAVLVSGDVADTGAAGEYAQARERLAALDVPVLLLAGNHDEPVPFEAAFGPPRWTAHAGSLRVIGCATELPGRDDGAVDLAWLEAALREAPEMPTLIAMHHPPVDVGLPALDAIGLAPAQRGALARLIGRHRQVRAIAAGHVHMTAVGGLGGVPVVTCASTNLQSRLEIGAPDFDIRAGTPGLLLHVLLDSGELVTHSHPIPR